MYWLNSINLMCRITPLLCYLHFLFPRFFFFGSLLDFFFQDNDSEEDEDMITKPHDAAIVYARNSDYVSHLEECTTYFMTEQLFILSSVWPCSFHLTTFNFVIFIFANKSWILKFHQVDIFFSSWDYYFFSSLHNMA